MTTQAPTNAELLTMCDDLIAAHEPCGECDQLLIARALRSRLSPHGPEWLEEIQKIHDQDTREGKLLDIGPRVAACYQHRATLLAQFRKATPGWRGIETLTEDCELAWLGKWEGDRAFNLTDIPINPWALRDGAEEHTFWTHYAPCDPPIMEHKQCEP